MKVIILLCFVLLQLTLNVSAGPHSSDNVQHCEKLISEAHFHARHHEYPQNSECEFWHDHEKPKKHKEQYDFIIVGGGTSGAVLARRLSREKSWKILLLEAGKPGNDVTNIPGLFSTLQLSDYNWGYYSTPQKTCCLGYKNCQCTYPRGKGLGGTSTINSMLFSRGNPHDYNRWAEEGNKDWSWKDVKPYFKFIENATALRYIDEKYRGFEGKMHLEANRGKTPINKYFLRASEELGRNTVDYNGKTQFGASIAQLNTKRGVRQSTENVYLKTIKHERKNLKIITQALVTKILIDDDKKYAYGVRFVHDGILHKVYAKLEVILSAGVINSPQLLMLSGIGPEKVLKKHNIKPILHLPVGRNFHDNPRTVGIIFTHNGTCDESMADAIEKYTAEGKGPLSTSGLQAISFINSKRNTNEEIPDLEHILTVQKVTETTIELVQNSNGWTNKATQEILGPLKNKCTWQTTTLLLNPKSRGRVSLNSADPLEFPLIDFNYFSDEDNVDLETMVDAIFDSFKLAKTEAFKSIRSKYESLPLRKCSEHKFKSRAYWRCYVKHMAHTTYNGAGTCKMGPKDDSTAVVDHKLRVHGIKNLRVIDESVIPFPIAGHLNAPIIMIAEKSVDIIRKCYKMQEK